MRKIYKSLTASLLVLFAFGFTAPAQTLVYNQSFISGATPTTQCTAWTTFCSTLLGTYSYLSFKVSGSVNPTGITCTNPVVTLAVANALRTGVYYSGSFTVGTTPHTVIVSPGCGSGCGGGGGRVIELIIDATTCTCAGTGTYTVRPAINNSNWGGINSSCSSPSQTLIVTFVAGPDAPTITGHSVYCAGETILDTAHSTSVLSPTYSWSGPSGFTATTAYISIPATISASGVYSCTVTDATGTSSATLDTITVVPLPTITPVTGPHVCYGSSFGSLTYTATGTPLTYSIAYDAAAHTAGFTDVTGAAITASPLTVFVPSTVPVGTYNATITLTNRHCTGPSASFVVTVNPVPAPITGVTNICTGSTITLYDASAGYTWSSTYPGVATIDATTGIVVGRTIGATTISYTDPSNGCAATAIVNVVGITGPNSVCATDSIYLSATSPLGTWSSGNTAIATVGTSGIVTGIGTGAVNISYTLGTGCIASWLVTVNPLALIAGRDSVCVGSVRNLTDIVGGGTWTTTFPLIASVVADSGKVTGRSIGTTTISYTLPVTGCMTTVVFNVVGYPAAITGTTRACPNSSTTLHDATGGGVWTSSDPSVATIVPTSGVLTGVNVDTVDVMYTTNPGCAVKTRVTINPLPAPITGNSVMCPGTTDTLHDATRGGLWSSITPTVATSDTGILTGITGGIAVISYTLPTGCARVAYVTVDVAPAPIVTYYTGALYVDNIYSSYQWYDSLAGLITGATSPSIAAANDEYYYVVVTDSNGCKGTSALYHFNSSMEGVNNVTNSPAVNIYPNPTTGVLYIDAPVKVRAVITSIEGTKEIDIADAKEVNIAKLANGLYFITLYDNSGNTIAVRKITKQ